MSASARALMLCLAAVLTGCATKPKRTFVPVKPPMPVLAFKREAVLGPPAPWVPKPYRILWDENPETNIVYVISLSTNLIDWMDVAETNGIVFPIVADKPAVFYRIGARWK